VTPKRIRGGSGLGDSIYVRPISDHFVRKGHAVTVCTNYPDVFIGSGAKVEPFSRMKIDVHATYTSRKFETGTNQWQDVCHAAKLTEPLPLRFGWTVRNQALIGRMLAQADGRPIILLHGGRTPMGRNDGFGRELLPEKRAFDAAIRALNGCFLVRVGAADKYAVSAHVDLNGSTTVSDLLDLGVACDGVLAQCSFAVPLAEAFGKPLLAVWSAQGLAVTQKFINAITPQKILSAATSRYVIDDWHEDRIAGIARETFTFQECCT
jgi:hypothetical protein